MITIVIYKYHRCQYCSVLKIDSCSLIYLAKSDLLPVAAQLYRDLRITRSVYEEVVVEGKKRNRPDAFLVESHVQSRKLGVVDFEGGLPAEMKAMGRGESETVMESQSEKCPALLDDIRSKAYAARSAIEYTSADILLIEALARKKITPEEFGDYARKLGKACSMRAERFAELLRIGTIIGGNGK
jgi:predicted nucleic acid-binding protein